VRLRVRCVGDNGGVRRVRSVLVREHALYAKAGKREYEQDSPQ